MLPPLANFLKLGQRLQMVSMGFVVVALLVAVVAGVLVVAFAVAVWCSGRLPAIGASGASPSQFASLNLGDLFVILQVCCEYL